MKRIVPLFVLLCFLGSCKKSIQDIKEDLVIKAMTDGQWKVTSFTRNGTDITADFSGYRFKYYKDKTVDAIKNSVFEMKGQWSGDAATMTTWANFTAAVQPLVFINGDWHIDNNSWTFVVASQVIGVETKTMRLEKE
jgi:hypothetical protein